MTAKEYAKTFFNDIGSVELHPSVTQEATEWDVPSEPRIGWYNREGFWEMCKKLICIPCPKLDCSKLATPPHIHEFPITFLRLPDHSPLRKMCRQIRGRTLDVLRDIVALEYYMSKDECLRLDHWLKYETLVHERILKPLEKLDTDVSLQLIVMDEKTTDRYKSLLQLGCVNDLRQNWETHLDSGNSRSLNIWMALIWETKNKLRYVSDRLGFALNKAPFWSFMVNNGCYAKRERIIVRRDRSGTDTIRSVGPMVESVEDFGEEY